MVSVGKSEVLMGNLFDVDGKANPGGGNPGSSTTSIAGQLCDMNSPFLFLNIFTIEFRELNYRSGCQS